MRYFISAGEPSGDLHASQLIASLRQTDADAEFVFLGGDLMARQAQCEPVIHYRRMAFMGFSEVLRNLDTIRGNFVKARKALADSGADALVLVDYPSFNLRLARYAVEHLKMPVYYYIAPKVWAWKQWRVKQLQRYCTHVLCILPFEQDYFRAKGVQATYVGNPSVEEVCRRLEALDADSSAWRKSHGLDAKKPILALVPGSRRGEIRNNLPIMAQVASRHPRMQAVVAVAPGADRALYEGFDGMAMVNDDTLALMHYATNALVTSGTATLECALAGTPQVVCYRANGQRISYWLMSKLVHVPYVSLPNLVADAGVVPEMLVHQCTVEAVDAELNRILPETPGRQKQLAGYEHMKMRLGQKGASARAARMIVESLRNNDTN